WDGIRWTGVIARRLSHSGPLPTPRMWEWHDIHPARLLSLCLEKVLRSLVGLPPTGKCELRLCKGVDWARSASLRHSLWCEGPPRQPSNLSCSFRLSVSAERSVSG